MNAGERKHANRRLLCSDCLCAEENGRSSYAPLCTRAPTRPRRSTTRGNRPGRSAVSFAVSFTEEAHVVYFRFVRCEIGHETGSVLCVSSVSSYGFLRRIGGRCTGNCQDKSQKICAVKRRIGPFDSEMFTIVAYLTALTRFLHVGFKINARLFLGPPKPGGYWL